MHPLRRFFLAGLAASCLVAVPAWSAPAIMGSLATMRVAGDVNNDGITDARDTEITQGNLGLSGGLSMGDVTGDGLISLADLSFISDHLRARPVGAYFGRVVDSNTTPPASSFKFLSLGAPVLDGTNLVFFGNTSDPFGIYRSSGTSLTRVVDDLTPVPSGNKIFSYISTPAVSGTKVFFMGRDEHLTDPVNNYGDPGLYANLAGTTSMLVNKNTAKPEGGTFGTASLGDPRASGNVVMFGASGGSALYGITPTGTVKVVDTATLVPGSTTNKFTSFSDMATDGTDFYFLGVGNYQTGLYKKSGATLSALLNATIPVPGTSQRFGYLSNLSNDGSNFSFYGSLGTRNGIFSLINNTVTTVADTSTVVPGGVGKFTEFGFSAIGGTSVAFVGYDARKLPGLYAWIDGQLVRVVDTNILLDGKVISKLEISDDSVSTNKVAFKATFTDSTFGLYVASILPPFVAGDLNGDNVATKADFTVLWRNLGLPGNRAMGDLDGDGTVTMADLQILERYAALTSTAPLLGDADGNGKVDMADQRIVARNIGKAGTNAQGDFDLDGLVTLTDLQVVERNLGAVATPYAPFGHTASPGEAVVDVTAVPEPATGALLVAAVAMLMRRNRAQLRRAHQSGVDA